MAELAGVSQGLVSLVERGQLDRVSLRSLRSIGQVLDVALPFAPRWRGGELDRLLDAAHAALIDYVAATLRGAGWSVLVEYTFNHFGERGSVDLVAWHDERRVLLLIAVKSRLTDLQALMMGAARKLRIIPDILARNQGWRPTHVGTALVMPGTRFNRSVVERHAATFGAAFPMRSREVQQWVRSPAGSMRGLWFVAPSSQPRGMHHRRGTLRVRRPRRESIGGRPRSASA